MEQNISTAAVLGKQVVQRSEGEIMQLVEEYEKSGFSVKDFCEVTDISEGVFESWLKKHRSKGKLKTGFAPIEVTGEMPGNTPQLFAEIGNIKIYRQVPAEYLKTLIS